MWKRNTAFLALAVVLAGCGDTVRAPAAPGDPSDVQVGAPGRANCLASTPAMNEAGVRASNSVRQQAGLPPLRANAQLSAAAAAHACDMAQRGRMTHRGSSTAGPAARVRGVGYTPQVTAENIAAGPFTLPQVLEQWHRSPSHLSNVRIPQVRDFGIGEAVAADGRTRYWAAVYAAPR